MTGLLAALFFIALFSAMAMPRLWGTWTSMRLEAEAARLAAELTRYRETVMTKMPAHQDFEGINTGAAPLFRFRSDGYQIDQGTETLLYRTLPEGMTLSYAGGIEAQPGRPGAVNFLITGNASTMTVILQSGKEMRYVIIDRVGRVRVSLTPPDG